MVRFVEDRDLAINFRNLRLLESVSSPIQKIELFEHPKLGRILVLDDEVHHVERWQALYHEPLIHLPCAFVPEVRNVLVLGGGSLFAASEALRYPTLVRCTLVDHDPSVLEVMSRHYAHARAVVEDRRFCYVTSDAIDFLKSTRHTYDLVVNDGFDSVQTTVETANSVFELMAGRRTPDGVCADVIYRDIFERQYTTRTLLALRTMKSAYSLVIVPEYPGVLHLLACWGSELVSQELRAPINRYQKQWIAKKSAMPALQFYNPEFISFYLYLPPYLKNIG
jgi:spermidine synthase